MTSVLGHFFAPIPTCLLFLACHALAPAATVSLAPVDKLGVVLGSTTAMVDGKSVAVWTCDEKTVTCLFPVVPPMVTDTNGAIYLTVVYHDAGYGRISVQLGGRNGKIIKPDRYLNLARTDSRKLVTARMRFKAGEAGIDGAASVSIGLEHPKGETLNLVRVTLADTPPTDDASFAYVLTDPWQGPYVGLSEKPADNTTLKGKVMVGYQGWFRTPNDPEGQGWHHWGDIDHGHFSIDMWPDVSGYPAHVLEKAADVKLASGKQGYLFSSCWPEVVDTHFHWMRKNNIDGAFLQRFGSRLHGFKDQPEWVLANVRAAANRSGRLWALEYDASGCPDETIVESLKKDWAWLVDEFGIKQDPCYAREGGKPVVFIWGLPFPNRNFTPQTANAVVDFFANDPQYGGNHVIGGIPGNWKHMDAAWQEHFRKYHSHLAWQSRAYAEDLAGFKAMGIPYYAQIFPGFSWANLKHLPTGDDSVAYTPRKGGEFYWDLINKATQAGCDRLFVGMFDEYDEGTAIMPMSDDSPPTPSRPGVGATFYKGAGPQESGDFKLLSGAEYIFDGRAPSKRVPGQDFFIRMGGSVTFPSAGLWTFSIEGVAGDGACLWVGGTKVLEVKKLDGVALAKLPYLADKAGPIPYRLDYRHGSASGTLRLLWEGPGVPRQPVPATALNDAWGRFITNDGKPADQWLKLTAAARDMINGKRPVDGAMP